MHFAPLLRLPSPQEESPMGWHDDHGVKDHSYLKKQAASQALLSSRCWLHLSPLDKDVLSKVLFLF